MDADYPTKGVNIPRRSTVIAKAMGYKAEPPPVPEDADNAGSRSVLASSGAGEAPVVPPGAAQPERAPGDPDRHPVLQWLDGDPGPESADAAEKEYREPGNSPGPIRI